MVDELDECSEPAICTDDTSHYAITNRDGRVFRETKCLTYGDSSVIALSVRFCKNEAEVPCIYRAAVPGLLKQE